MCMWCFGNKIDFDRIMAFLTYHVGQLLIDSVWCLCNHLLPEFSMECFQTLHIFSKCIEDVQVEFDEDDINFDGIMEFDEDDINFNGIMPF